MRRNRWVVLALVSASCAAWGQSDYVLWLTPKINEFEFIGEAQATHYGAAEVEKRPEDISFTEYKLRVRYPFNRTETSEWFVSLDTEVTDVGGEPRLRRSVEHVPGTLYDVGLGLTHRRFVHDDWLVGGSLQVGSATDRPFNSVEEMYLSGTTYLTVPHLEHTAWLFYVNLDTSRDIPVLPGIGYEFPLGRRVMGVVGVPILGFGGEFSDSIAAEVFYVPLHNVHAKVSYKPAERVKTYVGFDWQSKSFTLADRRDEDDRFELEQKLLKGGVEFSLTEEWALELNGGYAFDRSMAQGEDRDERSDERLRIDDTWFTGLKFRMRF